MKPARGTDDLPSGIGWRRILALAALLASAWAVASLERLGGAFDLKLLYFLIALSGAMLLPRRVAIALAAAVAVISAVLGGARGLPLAVDLSSRLLIYAYAALLTSNWEHERRRLMQMSRVDELTGLYNLRALREQMPIWLGPAARTGRSMAVLMLDIDGFKTVNDRLGHAAGNDLLREVANLLRVSVRVGDSLFRFGGDEFVLLLSDTDADGAGAVARRVQQAHHDLHQTEPATGVTVTLSFGLAVFPADGSSPETLLKRADEALYDAKHIGGGAIQRYAPPKAA
jgi:diguanylate cyclase (GGDEF)-like protein